MVDSYLMVLIGGAMGAVCRYAVSIQMKRILSSEFPLATFLINLTGSFLLGLLRLPIRAVWCGSFSVPDSWGDLLHFRHSRLKT
jgi:CrcB protein